ncbi:MAG: glycosyltransferase family 2 protein [Xanthomonadales bacterium]|nr:glycosyltransferase family 2 protein [Xanthomonadales bacterium]
MHMTGTHSSEQPLVSIILIFLDEERFLADAVNSILEQTFTNWELILVDDGSTDRSTELAKHWAKEYPEKISYTNHPGHANKGMSASRNLGFRLANGSLIALLDADDVWLKNKLAEQVEIMARFPEATLLYGLAKYWHDWDGKSQTTKKNTVPRGSKTDFLAKPPELLLSAYPLGQETAPCPSCTIFRRELIDRVGGFEESFRGMYEDQAFLTKVYLKEPIYVSSRVWIKYRIHPDSCCSQVSADGKYHHYRAFFLQWFWRHMLENRVVNIRVWAALIKAQLPYRWPRINRLINKMKSK